MFDGKQFDVEHALNMYALSYVTIPAEAIYDAGSIKKLQDTVKDCHVYIVGFLPKVDFVNVQQHDIELTMSFEVLGSTHKLIWELPKGIVLEKKDRLWYLRENNKLTSLPSQELCLVRLKKRGAVKFLVKYIGQAYGKDGSRNALDRLQKHETLQKIAIKGIPDGYRLQILMLAIEPGNRVITMFNPHALDDTKSEERIGHGLDKLFNTTEQERIALYEAALIRYFMPQYNKEFKNSFPSTNLKVLNDCYKKDFSAIVAEIIIDELPYSLYSEAVQAQYSHIAKYNLHTDEERRVFFS